MFALTFLAYNFKFLWAPLVDTVRIPVLGRFGQRRSWLWLTGVLVMAAIVFLGSLDPQQALTTVALAAILVGIAGATFDIIIDAYRIELLAPRQLGVGSGMGQYGWRIGAASAGAPRARDRRALRMGRWPSTACALFALPAMLVGVVMGEPARRHPRTQRSRAARFRHSSRIFSPLAEFIKREGAVRRPDFRADPQDWRHAREPDAAAAVPGSGIHKRRNRVLRRLHRVCCACWWVCSSAEILYARFGDETIGAHQPGADGHLEFRLCGARRSRSYERWYGQTVIGFETLPAASAV